ncbi:ATP-dependent helicase HrpB [Brevibacillus fluminis]|uniref:ATP-dependent helicase HrpB n=1 Tax=Brevibacillus fluminis TaxID=511487 RepID=A0A3M8DN33_9BACL|nr:ATP-dependent helicase HrpB [Brevibacillus fluminis]RNB89424.1 ATP-dependent helicase HrpB [Brevibacillus fluminis]
MKQFPVDQIVPEVKAALRDHRSAVLTAEPGAGKTTRVPIALLDEPWLAGQRILLLEPRRLAARSAASFMAASLGESVGETVGYRVRMDTKVGPTTRIEVITEGILTRMLQTDPALEGVGLIIFDEFHERSLHADLGLALTLQSRDVLREDLRILVMSATLEAEPVSTLLGQAPVIQSIGRMFPVETRYLKRPFEGRLEPAVVRTILEAWEQESGDLLVFLPGAAEIRRVEMLLGEALTDSRLRIAPLYGILSAQAQDRAIAPAKQGERKIVLATSIAETSLTVEGVRIVIDSGLMRVPRFSPRTGMTRLETIPVSKAAADQRRGRAGRLCPGVCYRLWPEEQDRFLQARSTPEILETDLAALVLELSLWGIADPAELAWLDLPPAGAFAQARELLRQLGALGDQGEITPHGRKMAELGVQPRLAHMILQAILLGHGSLACELAALLGERDIVRRGQRGHDADLRLRMELLHSFANGGHSSGRDVVVDEAAISRILLEAAEWKRALAIEADRGEQRGGGDVIGLLLAFAFPDRIAQRRTNGRFLLRNGRGAVLEGMQPLTNEAYLVAAELDNQGVDSRIYLAAPVSLADLQRECSEQFAEETIVSWDRETKSVQGRKRLRLGALMIKEVSLPAIDPQELLQALLDGIWEEGVDILPWTKASRQFQQRLCFLHQQDGSWPDMADEALAATLEDWLGPHLYGMKSAADLNRLNLFSALEAVLTWDEQRQMDELAPTHLIVPSGSRIPIDYSDPAAPFLSVRLQEMFGQQDTPRIMRGKVPLILHLLSPAQRPVQVTRDLASFWQNAYFEVKKDLKGRYPKHYWPEDPYSAVPTNRAKPKS